MIVATLFCDLTQLVSTQENWCCLHCKSFFFSATALTSIRGYIIMKSSTGSREKKYFNLFNKNTQNTVKMLIMARQESFLVFLVCSLFILHILLLLSKSTFHLVVSNHFHMIHGASKINVFGMSWIFDYISLVEGHELWML